MPSFYGTVPPGETPYIEQTLTTPTVVDAVAILVPVNSPFGGYSLPGSDTFNSVYFDTFSASIVDVDGVTH